MEYLFQVDLAQLFRPKLSLAEIVIRAFVIYAGLCLLLRVIPKRQVGHVSVTDMMFVVLVGGVSVETVARPVKSLTDGLLLIAAIMLFSYAFDLLAFHSAWFRRLLQVEPTALIRDGEVLQENLRRELMRPDDLLRELRRQDVADPSEVQQAVLENDGEISVVSYPKEEAPAAGPHRPAQPPPEAPREEPPGEPDEGEKPRSADAELEASLASAERLQRRLRWHQDKIA